MLDHSGWPPRRALELFFEAQRQGIFRALWRVGDRNFVVDVDEASIGKLQNISIIQ